MALAQQACQDHSQHDAVVVRSGVDTVRKEFFGHNCVYIANCRICAVMADLWRLCDAFNAVDESDQLVPG